MNLSSFSQTLSSSMSMIYSSQFTNHSPTVILPRFVLSPSSSCSTLFSLPIGRRTHHHHHTIRSFISHGDTLRVASHILRKAMKTKCLISTDYNGGLFSDILIFEETRKISKSLTWAGKLSCGSMAWLSSAQMAQASQGIVVNPVFEIGEVFELGIQLSYLLLLLGLLGAGTFFVIRQVLVRRELDLSAKELQEQVRSGDASATELFELGAVMLRRKFYPAATKYLLQAIDKWDGDDQDLAQVYNALGVSYVRDEKLDKGIKQFENAVRIQPGYTTAWNNLGDAYEKKKELTAALKAFEEVLLFDPNNKLARPRRDALKERVKMYKDEFVTMFRDRTKYPIVEPAHMELAEPSIRDAFNLCVQQGANRVIVSPFFLFPGRHWHQDIPSLTTEAAKEHSGISYIITAPLGLHELLVDVVNDRINHCLSHVAGDANECAGTGKCRVY